MIHWKDRITMAEIRRACCEAYKVSMTEFQGDCRLRNIAQARAAFCYWTRLLTGHSYNRIAMFLNMDRTTVSHHVETYMDRVKRYGDPHAIDCMIAVNRDAFERIAA